MAPVPRQLCFMDITIGDRQMGRVTVELFSDVCPKTCDNFRQLCTGGAGIGRTTGKHLHYKGCKFHRVIKNFMIQGGDFSAGTGQGGESIFGGPFDDENFEFDHAEPFMLSMANRGKNTNGSQFFITTAPAKHLDGVHVVFGKVISGHDIITAIEETPVDKKARPLEPVLISDCGSIDQPPEEPASDSESDHKKKERKKRKKEKKDKKHKKHKKEKREKNSPMAQDQDDDDGDGKIECSIDPEEIPQVPVNKFLYRSSPTDKSDRESFRRHHSSSGKLFEGRQVKGRGTLRFTRRRSRSSTPPHWRREQERLRPLNKQKHDENRRSDSPEERPSRRSDDRIDRRRYHSDWRRSRSRSPARRRPGRNDPFLSDRIASHSDLKRKHEERTSDVESDYESELRDRDSSRRLKSAVVLRSVCAPSEASDVPHQVQEKSDSD